MTREFGFCAAGALALALTTSAAMAQPEDGGPPPLPREHVQVTAPQPRPQFQPSERLGAPPQKVSLTRYVPYGDLDLATRSGAHELRARVREAALHICYRLDRIVPHAMPGTTSCYKTAISSGMIHANETISAARWRYREVRYSR